MKRPEGMDRGVLVMSGLKLEWVLEAVQIVTSQNRNALNRMVDDYASETVSTQIIRIVASYVDYVNRTVWHKT